MTYRTSGDLSSTIKQLTSLVIVQNTNKEARYKLKVTQTDSKTPLGMSSDEAKPHNTKLIAKCNFQVYPTMSSAELQLHGRQVHTYQAHKGSHKHTNYVITKWQQKKASAAQRTFCIRNQNWHVKFWKAQSWS